MDITTTPETLPSSPLKFSPLRIEIAKMLKLVAPISMGAETQAVWINAAIDALEDIRSEEVQGVSAEIRRSVTRPAQIVPEIARLVAERRERQRGRTSEASGPSLWSIHREGQERLMRAKTPFEIDDAQRWERDAMLDAGFPVRPIAPPLTRAELDKLPADIVALGLKGNFLERRQGVLYELAWPA